MHRKVFVEVCEQGRGNIIVGNLYKSPHSDAIVFLRSIREILTKISDEKKITYTSGDFNLDLLK